MSFPLKVGLLALCTATAYADLKPETLKEFQSYVQSLETKIERQNASPEKFLWIDRDPARREAVRQGKIITERMHAPPVSDGLVQHWIGGVFIPNTTLEKVIRIDQDYNRHKILYSPDVADSKILSHQGNHFKVFLRFRKHKVFTVVLDTEHEVDYIPLGEGRMYSRSTCNKVQEVKDPGTSSEHVLPVGEGMGFLWAMNSYWRLMERDGGVYAECDAITLARHVPIGLGGMVNPIIQSLASESLTNTLAAKRRAAAGAGK